ncbi:hypothetical protein ACG7TL_003017 [Trametes sanguinea]
MKFALVFLALAGSALAQSPSIAIFAPSANTTVAAGSNLVVDIEKLVSTLRTGCASYSYSFQLLQPGLSGPSDVSVVIGLRTCGADCQAIAATGSVGAPLYKGDYSPQVVPGSGSTAAFQNYTVQVPATMPKGPALLAVGHFFLAGVSQASLYCERDNADEDVQAALTPGSETVYTTVIVQ